MMKSVIGWSAGMFILTMACSDVCRAQRMCLSKDRFDVTIQADTVPAGGIPILLRSSEMGCTSNAPIRFTARQSSTHLPPDGPRFLLVTSSRGTTPANGKQARILYAGAAGTSAGMLQVNAYIPEGLASGPQPVALTVGANSNASSQQVTIRVR
jgi:hypothetical protein